MIDKKDDTLKLALEAHRALREWINAVPKDTPLPAMPGIDGDWLDEVDLKIQTALAEQPAQQESIAKDAEEWGSRLNEASWAAIEAWNADRMGPMSAAVFNNLKGVIRAGILKYLELTDNHKF